MTEHAAWLELLDAIKSATPSTTTRFKWLSPNRVVFIDRWQVQARCVQEPHRYSIAFERFGAELGDVNYEPTPGFGEPKLTILTMLLDLAGEEAFWRLADGRTLKSNVLAQWVIQRLPLFHDEYGREVTGLGF